MSRRSAITFTIWLSKSSQKDGIDWISDGRKIFAAWVVGWHSFLLRKRPSECRQTAPWLYAREQRRRASEELTDRGVSFCRVSETLRAKNSLRQRKVNISNWCKATPRSDNSVLSRFIFRMDLNPALDANTSLFNSNSEAPYVCQLFITRHESTVRSSEYGSTCPGLLNSACI